MIQSFLKLNPLVVLIAVILDSVWALGEMPLIVVGVGILALLPLSLLLGGLMLTISMLIQHFVDKDSWKDAFEKSTLIALIIAIPLPFLGWLAGAVYMLLRSPKQL